MTLNEMLEGVHPAVEATLNSIGISPDLKGYAYLCYGVQRVVENADAYQGGITKILYPEIAAKYGTTSSRVERCIRHAIQRSLDVHASVTLPEWLTNITDIRRGHPTNTQFPFAVSNKLRKEVIPE